MGFIDPVKEKGAPFGLNRPPESYGSPRAAEEAVRSTLSGLCACLLWGFRITTVVRDLKALMPAGFPACVCSLRSWLPVVVNKSWGLLPTRKDAS